MDSVLSAARSAAASAGGATLAAATRAVAAVRPAAKPLHPHGDVTLGRLRRSGGHLPTGVPWLDDAGTDDVLVRRSRAVGLPGSLPDVHGLALRVPLAGGGHADLLLASTGLGRLTRFVLTASRRPEGRPLTTLLPYRSPDGPLLVAAVPGAADRFELAYAPPAGAWRRFAELVVTDTAHRDALVSFDPLRNTIPGLENYEWVRRLREPSYGTARHTR